MEKCKQQFIYDLPTRIFHWFFVVLFIASFFIAKTIDDENPIFSFHMLIGLMLGGLVLLRIIWGFFGTRYARFSSFSLNPFELFYYFKDLLSLKKKRQWPGHNPASSWAALIMICSGLLLAITGILMTTGAKESFEDVHEILANTFLATALLHIMGVFFHSFRHQNGILFTMIHGKKTLDLQNSQQIHTPSSRPMIAFFMIILMGLFGTYLITNYNTSNRQLNLLGKTLFLGEEEKDEKTVDKNYYENELYDEDYEK